MVVPGARAGLGGLPSGPVTFFFSDIEGSTRLVKALREQYAEVLAEHRRLVRAAIAAHGGHEVDTQGDSFFAAFGDAKQAVLCALQVQRTLAAYDWPGGAQVRVRIGIHTGQAVLAGDGYTGLAVHRAARISAAAAGGQVLVSQATQALIEDEEEELGFTLVDVGQRALKDLDRPVRLFRLAAPGLDTPVPPAGWPGRGGKASGAAAASGGAGPGGVTAGGVHGFPVALTSFVGRAGPVREVVGLLGKHRLVTVTGPGGSGKTRLAGQVARQVAGRFADGAWLAELDPGQDPAQVPAVVASALGVREQRGVPAAEALARVLAGLQLLLVLDNCEHAIGAAAGLCTGLLSACDDLTILAISREPLAVTGEARYRLGPLALPDPDDPAGAARAEAVVLFADRARDVDAGFVLDGQAGPAVARLVARLEGMPLAIELAAARVEMLGASQLADRFAVLADGSEAAPSRPRSLAAVVDWSYRLLDETDRQVFRKVSVFPGLFTPEAAEAVAGAGAESAVAHLADCSLVVPPRAGADGRPRYGMLETLRAYGADRLAEAGEQDAAVAALAGWALEIAEQAGAGLWTSDGEQSAARRLDAEDATMRQVLAGAIERDPDAALRLAAALGPWWYQRGRLPGEYPRLREAAGRAKPGGDRWCAAQWWLGWMASWSADLAGALGHFTAVCDTVGHRGPSPALADALNGRSMTLANLGRLDEAAREGRRGLAMARELGYPFGESMALSSLSTAAYYSGDPDGAVELARQAGQVPGELPGWHVRDISRSLMFALTDAGELAAAEDMCAAGLAQARDAGDLQNLTIMLTTMGDLDVEAGRFPDAAAHLREALQIAARTSSWFLLLNVVDVCGCLCAATGRLADAVAVWSAWAALAVHEQPLQAAPWMRRQREALGHARQALGPDRARAAEKRGTAMSLATAAEYVLLLTAPTPPATGSGPELGQLSARERELVTLVAQGRTNAQIAAQLHVSVRIVASYLDRIRDKTGCRRRADLTRLALTAGLV